jgi:hypothetical protein
MKRLISFCLAILALSCLNALPAGSRPGGALPAYDARFLSVEITYTLNADGSWVRDYHHTVRYDTYYAINRALGETFIVYDPGFQKLEVLKSETTMADGRKVASPANAFNEVLPFAAHGFADFSGLREMVVTHVGLERGAVVDLRYRVLTKPGFLPAFSGRETLTRDFPVDSYKLEIVVPPGRELHYSVFGNDAAAKVSSLGGMDRYAFSFFKRSTAAHEPLAHPQSEPFIVFSTAPGWEQALAMESAAAGLPPSVAAKIEKLKGQYPDRADLLSALQKAVAVEVQNCPLAVEATGWRPRPLERVALSNYGTRLEKALLLRAMLKQAGFAPELLAVAGDAFDAKVATALQVNEFWVKVLKIPDDPEGPRRGGEKTDGQESWYLDPWQEQQELFPYRCHGLDAYNLDCQKLETMPASDWERSGVEISGTVRLDPAGASGTVMVAARGRFQNYGEATSDNGKFVTGLLKKFFPVEKLEIKKLLALTRGEFRAEATFSGPWLKDAGKGFFNADAVHIPGLSENMVQLAKRESPMLLEAPFKVSVNLDLEPAAGLKLEYAAPDVKRENETGYFSRSLVVEKNGHLRFSQGCGIAKSLIGPDKYPLLHEVLLPYFAPDFWLVFKKEK